MDVSQNHTCPLSSQDHTKKATPSPPPPTPPQPDVLQAYNAILPRHAALAWSKAPRFAPSASDSSSSSQVRIDVAQSLAEPTLRSLSCLCLALDFDCNTEESRSVQQCVSAQHCALTLCFTLLPSPAATQPAAAAGPSRGTKWAHRPSLRLIIKTAQDCIVCTCPDAERAGGVGFCEGQVGAVA